eukprot:1194395-Prorocentrum_minimum.AAC.1
MRVAMQIESQQWADKMCDNDRRLQEKAHGLDKQLQLTAKADDARLNHKMFEFFSTYDDVVITNIAAYRAKACEEEERRNSSLRASTNSNKGKAPEILAGGWGSRRAEKQPQDDLSLRIPGTQATERDLRDL